MDSLATLVDTMSQPWTPPQQPRQPQQPPQLYPPYQRGGMSQPPPGTVPLGVRPPAHVSIDSYGPPSSRVTPLVILVVVAMSIIVAVACYAFVQANPQAPAPSASRSADPTSTRSGGVPFEARNDGAAGYWQVTSVRWGADRVTVSVSMVVDKGTTKPSFYVFGNKDSKVYDSEPTAPNPDFGTPTLRPGQTATGNLVFIMPRGAGTLVLTDSGGRQISALPIQG